MKTFHRLLLASSLAVIPTVLVHAQLNAATSAAGTATAGTPALPPPPTAQTGQAGNNVTTPGSTTGVTAATATGVRTAPGVVTAPASTSPAANAALNAASSGRTSAATVVTAPTPGAPTAVSAGAETSVTIDTNGALSQIQTAPFASRDTLTTTVGSRIDASQQSLEQLRTRVTAAGSHTNLQFERALSEVRNREQALRSSLQSTSRTTAESAWASSQSALARDYTAYVEAVANAEAAAQGSIQR